MKKIVVIAVLLIVSIFYVSTTSFNVVDYFNNEGYIFTNNDIQTNLYSGNLNKTVEPSYVEEDQEILERWGTLYADVNGRKKINTVYPMYINDGAGIQFLDYDNVLYDSNLSIYDGYQGLNINNGEAYNNSFERADVNEYTLAKLNNNLYINVQDMEIKTIVNNYNVKLNSNLYMTPDHINYAYYDYGTFKFDTIDDVNEDSLVRIGSMEIKYGDLLISLGEMAIAEDITNPKQDEVQQPIVEAITYQGKAQIKHLKAKDKDSSSHKTDSESSKKSEKDPTPAIVVTPVNASIVINKKIDVLYDDPIVDKVFTFDVYDEKNQLINSVNTVGEDSANCLLSFDKPGFYRYYIYEKNYGYEDYAFDDSIKTLEVEITQIDNKLSVNRVLVDDHEDNVVTFTNSYSHVIVDGEVEGSVYIKKSFDSTGAERTDKKNFSFQVIKASNFAPDPDNANPTVFDEGLTGVSFKFIKEGTYEYIIKENDLGYNNYDFDSTNHIVKFVVQKDGDNLKIVDQTIDEDKTNTVTFTNKYNGIDKVNVEFVVKNSITDVGNKRTRNKIFTYNVDLASGTYIEPENKQLQISDVGTSTINLSFDKPGVYEYKLTQLDKILDPTYDPYKELPRELVKVNNSDIYHYYVDDDPRDGKYDSYKYGEDDVRLYYGLDDSEYSIKITVTELDGRLYAKKEITRTQNDITKTVSNITFNNIFCSALSIEAEGESGAGSSTSSCLVCTIDIEGGGHGSGGHSSGEHEYEKQPENPEDPDTPTGDINPEGQHEHEDEPVEPVVPEWAMPTITIVDDYDVTTYTVTTKVKIVDPANVINDNKVTYEIILNEGENAGKTYKRVSFDAGYGEHEYTINGLRANTDYIIKAYFRYRDEMNKLVTTPVYYDNGTSIKTKDIGELGSIYVKPIDMTDSQILSNQVNIPYLSFDISEGKSSKDALSSIDIVTVELTDENGKTHLFRLTNDNVNRLINGQTISYTTKNTLNSGMNYTGKIVCYDMYGNLIDIVNDTFTAHTCKKLPKATVKLTYPSLDSVTVNTTITIPDANEYVSEYNNLRAVITDAAGNVIPFDGVGYKEIVSGEPFTVDGLGLNKTYTLTILMDCDNGDGTGITSKQLYSKPFVTGRLSDLGNLYLNVSNETKNVFSSDDVQDKKNLATRAILNIQLNDRTTKEDLLNFVDELYITLSHDTDRYQYKLTDEELAILLSSDPDNRTVEIDTNKFVSEGLLSNTEYSISYQAKYAPEGEEALNIGVRSTLSKFKTNRMPLITKIDSLDAYTGFIVSKFKVEDIDNIIEGNTYVLRVVKIEDDGKMNIVGSYNINKNEDFELNMFADAESSTDGLSHIIEGNSEYAFRFIAKEANLDTGVQTGYLFHEERFSTKQSLDGEINLIKLEDFSGYRGNELPDGYTQVEYIDNGGKAYLDLGFKYKTGYSIELDYMRNSMGASGSVVLSSSTTNPVIYFPALNGSSTQDRFIWRGFTSAETGYKPTIPYGQRAKVKYDASTGNMYHDGALVGTYKHTITTETKSNLNLFSTGGNSYVSNARVYSLRIYNSSGNIIDLIPVKRDSDNVYGFYDTVTGNFYKSTSSSSFTGGSEVVVPNYDGQASYIANGIYSKSLSGPSKLGTKTWYYDLSLINNDYMPIVGISTTNPYRYWDGVNGDGMNYETVIANPVTNEKNHIAVKQGVYLPFTGKFNVAYEGMYNLFTNYDKYLRGQMNYDEFIGSSKVGNVDSNIELVDVYAQDVDTLNIDISEDLIQLYNVENRSSDLPDGFEQLQYIEATGTQYIDLGSVVTKNTSATIEYQPTSISGSQAIFGGSWAGNRFLLDIQSSRWYWHGNSKNSGITPVTNKPSIITVSKSKFIVNGTEFSTSDTYTGSLKLLGLGSSSYNAKGKLYSFKLYESGTIAHDYVPVRRISDGIVGLYDVKTSTFYTNGGTGSFVAGNGLPTIKVEVAGVTEPIINSSLDKRTYSFDYDFVNDVKVTLSYTNASNNYVTRTKTFQAKDLRNRIGNSNNKLYYIGEDGKLYSSDSDAIYINEEFANVFKTNGLTKDGTLYDLSSKSTIGSSTPNTVHTNSEPIYKFSLSSGVGYNTFGTYSINDANAISSLNRFYSYDGNLIMLRDGQDGSYNPYFKNNKYEAYLRDDGKLISLGNVDLVDFLNKAQNTSGANIGFNNENIKKITASFDVNNTVIGFTYNDGRSVGYDISGSKAILLFETNSDPALLAPKKAPNLMTFLTNSLSNLFSLPTSNSITDERSDTEDLVMMMSAPNMSLNKVVSTLNDSGELSELLDENDLSFVLNNNLSENSDIDVVENNLDSTINLMTLANFNMSKDGVESYNLQPKIEGLTDVEDLTSSIVDDSKVKSNDYVLVYNDETEEFDIYTTKELIENPTEPVSENYKVIDKSTLKSLYQAFDDENKDDAHGITLYVVIAGTILVLTTGIALSTKSR